MEPGAFKKNDCIHFRVFAPLKKSIDLHLVFPEEKIIPMEIDQNGYWHTKLDFPCSGLRYFYNIDKDRDRPDPLSFSQPEGVHGPSEVIDHSAFNWTDDRWHGIPLEKMVLYELHTGTFTKEGTFEGIIKRIDDLKELGVNAIELMPVSSFPGSRNWGYDGVYPFAVQNSYGGPQGLKKLVNFCHQKKMAVVLDVVYNHLGPEGNTIWDFAPYFTDRYKTPWGWAINFDGEYSREVRDYFIFNVLYWFKYFHIDALRLDAVHGIYDFSAKHILREMADKTDQFSKDQGRPFYLIAESDLNNAILVTDQKNNGYGIHGQWNDDFHHCIHTLLTNEKTGYYGDFGKLTQLEKCLTDNYVYSGQYSPFRKRNHGNSAAGISGSRFVVFSQNHDQTGNRMNGERLSNLVDFDGLKLAAGMTLLSPFIPLIFMGEEYGENAPFLYFISHQDPNLIEAVRNGRKKEFEAFHWKKDPPDPYDTWTFEQCILQWEKRTKKPHSILLNWYRELIRLRRVTPVLSDFSKKTLSVHFMEDKSIMAIHRSKNKSQIFIVAHFSDRQDKCTMKFPIGKWIKRLDSYEEKWLGKGSILRKKKSNQYEIELKGFGLIIFQLN
ncbi:MAG: malto-oligosyltrehalose trehalohydrolase [Candidatus Aureabacteria bacterium]|nr:malto-oligosyltrehalose trehalohydrolase [Candidatus Auribacterota bacterium]